MRHMLSWHPQISSSGPVSRREFRDSNQPAGPEGLFLPNKFRPCRQAEPRRKATTGFRIYSSFHPIIPFIYFKINAKSRKIQGDSLILIAEGFMEETVKGWSSPLKYHMLPFDNRTLPEYNSATAFRIGAEDD
jgi:hypothetical protein